MDTPGLHLNPKNALNRIMIKTAMSSLQDVDVIVFVVDARRWTGEDQYVLEHLISKKKHFFLVLNKIDRISEQEDVLTLLTNMQEKLNALGLTTVPMIPVSAKTGKNINTLENLLLENIPESIHFFADDQLTDRSDRFMASELVREKLMRHLGEEVPHSITVQIEQFKKVKNILHVHAIIWVERDGQKKIVIGEKGEGLKQIGTLARTDMEKIFDQKVFLQLWVKVKRGWSDDIRALASLGYD